MYQTSVKCQLVNCVYQYEILKSLNLWRLFVAAVWRSRSGKATELPGEAVSGVLAAARLHTGSGGHPCQTRGADIMHVLFS